MIQVTKGEISVGRAITQVGSLQAGAVVIFLGTVRAFLRGEKVKHLEYEAYEPMARKELVEIENEARSCSAAEKEPIIHRVGKLEVGKVTLFVVTGALHRKDAFLACAHVGDELKGGDLY